METFKNGDLVRLMSKYDFRNGRVGKIIFYGETDRPAVHWLHESDGSPLKTKDGRVIKKPVVRRIWYLRLQKVEGS